MLSTKVKNPIITILFYICVIEVKYRKQNLSFKPLEEQSILMKLPVTIWKCYLFLLYTSQKMTGVICILTPPTPPRQRFVKFFNVSPCIYLRCCIPGGGGGLFVCVEALRPSQQIFQSCRDGATASWVINQYFRGVKCLAQGHNTAAVGIEPPTSRSALYHWATALLGGWGCEGVLKYEIGIYVPCRV